MRILSFRRGGGCDSFSEGEKNRFIYGFLKGFGPTKLRRRYGDDTWKRGPPEAEGELFQPVLYNSSSHLNALGERVVQGEGDDGIGAGK